MRETLSPGFSCLEESISMVWILVHCFSQVTSFVARITWLILSNKVACIFLYDVSGLGGLHQVGIAV